MFYLRKVENENNRVSNQCLGDNYKIRWHGGDVDSEKFLEECKIHFDWMKESDMKDIIQIVTNHNGSESFPIFKGNKGNYIMTENGNTFEKLLS